MVAHFTMRTKDKDEKIGIIGLVYECATLKEQPFNLETMVLWIE